MINKFAELEYSPKQGLLSALAAGAGTYGTIQGLNTLDMAFGLPKKLKNVNKAIKDLEAIAKTRSKGDLSFIVKNILKDKDKLDNIYKLRDEIQFAIDSSTKSLTGGISQQGHSILHNNLLGNKLTERIVNNSLRTKIFPSALNAQMGNFCPVGRRAILASTLALLGASLGGLRKKTASVSNYDISYSIPQAIATGGLTGATGLGGILLSNELSQRKLLKELLDKAKTKNLSLSKTNILDRLLRQKSGLYSSTITGYPAEEVRKQLPYEKLSKLFNNKIRSSLGFINPKTKLPIEAKNKIVEGILKRTTPLTALIGLSTLLGGLSLKKTASSSSHDFTFDPTNAIKGLALGAGGTAMANEIIGDYIPAVANSIRLNKMYLRDSLEYPFSIDAKSGKLNVDMNKFRNLARKAKMYNAAFPSASMSEIANTKSLKGAKNIYYKYFNFSDNDLAKLKKEIKAADFLNDYFKGDYGILNPIKNIISSKATNNKIFNKLNNLIKNPKDLNLKSYAQQFFNPKHMKLKNKLVYLMGLLGAAGLGFNKN